MLPDMAPYTDKSIKFAENLERFYLKSCGTLASKEKALEINTRLFE